MKSEVKMIRSSAGSDFGFRISDFGLFSCLLAGCLLLAGSIRADEFGDVSVSADAIYTGSTYHGYAERRVVVENHSPTRTHRVTLVYPGQNFHSYGNSISRLSRTVSVAPDSREVVSLLQPPLPSQGDGIRVEVDGRHEGDVRAPNANSHCNTSWRGGPQMATVLVSRSLDFDAVSHLYEPSGGAFTAGKAVGPPDATGAGFQPNCWMPDTRVSGRTNWLELDYAPPLTANKLVIHGLQSPPGAGTVVVLGASGTNLATLAMGSGRSSYAGTGWEDEFDFPTTVEPVKTVRLDFAKTLPHMIEIDAVQLSGPAGSQWAADARASSDNNASAARYRPGGPGMEEVQCLRAESPVSEWSENWLAYSPFDAVVVEQADVASMTPAVLAALDDYAQAGGNIVLLGANALPALWHAAQTRKLHDGAEAQTGFGNVLAFNAENPSALDAQSAERLRDVARDSARYFQGLPNDNGAANAILPVVQNLKIPTRGTVIIMLAFVIAIGPVNMIYLNRIKRRTWMLWTIPAISFATTLLVFAYSLLREGVTPNTRIAGLTVLDQASHHSATVGGEAFYCPLTPSGGLSFDFNTEATPLVSVGYGGGTPREVDWTQSQHFQRGWVSARVPEHFHIRKPETRRERIQVVNESGKLQVINSLGAPIKSLWYADANMNCFAANNVAAGEKGALLRTMTSTFEKSGPQGLLRDLGFAMSSGAADSSVSKYLRPNTYIAVLDGNPFMENALGASASARRTKSSCVVFGILEEPEMAGGAQ